MTEDLPLRPGVESKKPPAVFLDDQFGKQTDPGSSSGQPGSDTHRDSDRIPHPAVGLHHEHLAIPLGEQPSERGYHRCAAPWTSAAWRVAIIRWVRATATPSAASSGLGGVFRRSSWPTMYPTCGFNAPPLPTIVFLTEAGEYSAISTPAISAARRMTPRA